MFLQFKSKFLYNTIKYIGICPKCHEDIVLDDKVFKENAEGVTCYKCQLNLVVVNFKFNKYGLRIGVAYGQNTRGSGESGE